MECGCDVKFVDTMAADGELDSTLGATSAVFVENGVYVI